MNEKPLTSLELRIIEQFGKIIHKFPVLHPHWEQDGTGYIVANIENVETESFTGPLITPKLVLTNHSKPYEASSEELRKHILLYEHMIEETNKALKLIECNTFSKKISHDPMWQKPLSTSNPIPNTTSP